MVSITPCRTMVSERFPVASFVVQVPPQRLFEVAFATDPQLFHVDHQPRRTPQNFATSRAGGLMRAPAGQATYIIPPQQLCRFAGATRLYFALGTYGGPRGEEPLFTVTPDTIDRAPCIQIAPDFTGRSLDRGRLNRTPAGPRYGSVDPEMLTWGGDQAMRARTPARPAQPESSAAAARLGGAAPAGALAYDDGFDAALWSDNPSHQDRSRELMASRKGEIENRAEEASRRHDRRTAAEAAGKLAFLPVRGIENVGEEFKDRVHEIAEDLGVDANHLMAVMSFETGGTFSPSVRNGAGSGATGLIQFMPATAKGLGTTVEKLAAMTAEEQLDYVWKYLEPRRGALKTVEDTYMAVLWPAGIGKGSAHVIFRQGDAYYEQNRGLDSNSDGEVTVGEAAGKVSEILVAARSKAASAADSAAQAAYGRPDGRYGGARFGSALARWSGQEPDGYEDAPDIARRPPPRAARAPLLGRPADARWGGGGASLARAHDAPVAEGPPAPTPTSARFPDYSDGFPPEPDLPDEVASGMAAGDLMETGAPLDAGQRLGIIHHVAALESGDAAYSAINADTEYENPRLPGFYRRRHVGLSWGFIQFAQAFGGLGKALTACRRRDEVAFALTFGPGWSDLLTVTCATTEQDRIRPVVPPGSNAPAHLWEPPWTSVFRAAGQLRPFQEAQREVADVEYYAPYVPLLGWLDLSSVRAQAMFFDRSIHMGPGAAIVWILRAVSPIRTRPQRDAALRHLGFQDIRSFQSTPSHAGAEWPAADGVWGPRTHAALLWSLRERGGSPVALPGRDEMLDLMVADAGRRAAASAGVDDTWHIIHTRLGALRADPALAQLPRAP